VRTPRISDWLSSAIQLSVVSTTNFGPVTKDKLIVANAQMIFVDECMPVDITHNYCEEVGYLSSLTGVERTKHLKLMYIYVKVII